MIRLPCPAPVSQLSGDRKPQDKVDAKAELDEIRNSMKMKRSQKNFLKFIQNIEIIAEQKVSLESMIPRLILW